MAPVTILKLKDVGCSKAPGQPIFTNVNFEVEEGDIIVLQGKSGSGKTTLLKCLAHLNVYEGEVTYRNRTPKSYGVPQFRTRILYVPQRPSLLPGTPRDFLNAISSFGSRKAQSGMLRNKDNDEAAVPDLHEPIEVASAWGVDEELWDRNWSNLSGGETQRLALAIAVGLKTAEVLLLDEPTSALDARTTDTVEKYLLEEVKKPNGSLKAMVWITHSAEQGQRVGTRFLRVTAGGVHEDSPEEEV
ncbi:hypothetical protein EIP86_004172 [Pleurotus ostreatoroseus]|nr:hypothetical protein EIP86_004172 [Pleurotus ostreatoroseus]